MMNVVVLGGHVVADPELKTTPTGKTVCTWRLAHNMKRGGKDETLFIGCEAWEEKAKFIAEFFKKGSGMYVQGRLRQDHWETNEGQKRNRIELVAHNVEFWGPKQDDDAQPASRHRKMTSKEVADDFPF